MFVSLNSIDISARISQSGMMPEPTISEKVKNKPRHRWWRFWLALLLGLGTWWLTKSKPLWHIDLKDPQIIVPMWEDSSGKWLAASDGIQVQRKTNVLGLDVSEVQIIDIESGQIRYRLSNVARLNDWAANRARLGPRIFGQALWWFTKLSTDNGLYWQLHRWRFTIDSQDSIVSQWPISANRPHSLFWANNGSPYFMVIQSSCWADSLIPLASDPHSLLVQSLGIETIKKNEAPVPWVQTYRLDIANELPLRQLGSWTLPRFTWSMTCCTGDDLRWIAFGDTTSVSHWPVEEIDRSCDPRGVLYFDGHTGQPRRLEDRPESSKDRYLIESNGELLRLRKETNRTDYLLYSGVSGKLLDWPVDLSQPSSLDKLLRDQQTPSCFTYPEDGKHLVLRLKDHRFEHIRTTELETDDRFRTYHVQFFS